MYPPPPDLWSGGVFVHAPPGPRRRLLLMRRGCPTLPSFPELPVFPGGGSAVNTRWPVYVSYPAFLWDTAEDGDGSGSCGCCRN